MGEQIKILDLANKMISIYRNNFYNENKDIKITFTGLKKGEKMPKSFIMVLKLKLNIQKFTKKIIII